jgi:hypothetical protein
MSRDIGVDANINKIRVKEVASPATPASGYGYIYAKTDGLYFKGDDGTEVGPLSSAAKLLFEGKRTTDQSITANTTAFNYDSIAVNVGSAWASGVFTAPSTGIYMILMGVCTSSAIIVTRLYVNGTAKADGVYTSTGGQRNQCTFIESISAGTTLEVRSSGNCTLSGTGDDKLNWCRVVKLG